MVETILLTVKAPAKATAAPERALKLVLKIYKRFFLSRTGKFTEEEMEYLTTNSIPF